MSRWRAQHRAYVAELLTARVDPRDPRVPQWARVALALACRSPQRRRELRAALRVTEESIKAAVRDACACGVAHRIDRGRYAAHPGADTTTRED